MKREKISEQINFIGCWNIENENLCDSIVKFFEDRKELQYPGVTGYGKDDSAKKSTDISIEPKNLNLSEYQILKEYMSELYKCYCDYKNQWPFLKETIKTVDIPRFNIQKYQPGGHYAKIHSERSTTQSMHRIFAWMTYLNNVDDSIEIILKNGKTEEPGDGIIYIANIEDAFQIKTGDSLKRYGL